MKNSLFLWSEWPVSSRGVPVGVGDWNKVMKRGKGKKADTLETGRARGGRHNRWSVTDDVEGWRDKIWRRGSGEELQLAYLLPWQGLNYW